MISTLNVIAEHWFDWQVAMLWQTAALIAIVWIVDLAIRKWAHPQVRYALWMLVLVKLLIPPTWTSPASVTSHIPGLAHRAATVMEQAETEVDDTQTIMPAPLNHPGLTATPPSKGGELSNNSPPFEGGVPRPVPPKLKSEGGSGEGVIASMGKLSWQAYAMFTWLAGIIVLSTWLIVRLSGLRREHSAGWHGQAVLGRGETSGGTRNSHLPERFYVQLEAVAAKLNLKRLPRVVLTDKVACPAVFGMFRPVLLMPAEKFKNMSHQDTEHILLHELAHIKRGDLLVHAVWMLVQIVYWFNPLLWMIRRTLQNLRELCCDATVAKLLKEDTVHYRQTLLETARQLLAEPVDPGLGLLGLFENNNWLVTRLQWLEKNTWKNRPWRITTIILLVSVMTVCVLPMANRPAKNDFFIDTTQGYLRCNASIEDMGRMLIDMAHTYKWKHVYSKGVGFGKDGPEPKYSTEQYLVPPNHKLTIEAVGENKQPLNIRFTLENGADYSREEIMIELARRLGMMPKTKPLKVALPSDVQQAILLPEYFESHTVLSLKTGQLVPQQQTDESKEPYLYYGYTFPPGANPRQYTVDTIPENYIGVEAGNMDLAAGGFDPESKSRDYFWSIETIEQLPPMSRIKIEGPVYGQAEGIDGVFVVPPLDTSWPYVTAFKGDDGTYGIFEIATVQDRKIYIKFKNFNRPKELTQNLVPPVLHRSDERGDEAEGSELQTNNFTPTVKTIIEAIEKSLPDNYFIKEIKQNRWPTHLERGNGIALYIADKNIEYLKQQYSGTMWLMPKDYAGKSAIEDAIAYEIATEGQSRGPATPPGVFIAETTNYRVYSSPIFRDLANNIVKVIEQSEEEFTHNYSTTLPNGVTVELLGVCEYPSKGKQWWSPDGGLLENPPINTSQILIPAVEASSGRSTMIAAVKVENFKEGIGFRYKVGETENSASTGSKDQKVNIIVFDQAADAIETDISVGIAAGQWHTVATQKGDFSGVHSSGDVIWHGPVESADKTVLNFAHTLLDKNVRVVAVGRDGKEYIGGSTSSQKAGMESVQVSFTLPLSKIKEFQFQTRPYDWVTFKNISLRLGGKTDPEIENLLFDFRRGVEWKIKEENIEKLAQRGKTVIPILIQCLRQELPDNLSKRIEESYEGKLLPSRGDGSSYGVQECAEITLVKIGKPAVPMLIDSIETQPDTIASAVDILGEIGDSRATDKLIKIVQDREQGWYNRIRAAESLEKLNATNAIPYLIEALEGCNDPYNNEKFFNGIADSLAKLSGQSFGFACIPEEDTNTKAGVIPSHYIFTGSEQEKKNTVKQWQQWWSLKSSLRPDGKTEGDVSIEDEKIMDDFFKYVDEEIKKLMSYYPQLTKWDTEKTNPQWWADGKELTRNSLKYNHNLSRTDSSNYKDWYGQNGCHIRININTEEIMNRLAGRGIKTEIYGLPLDQYFVVASVITENPEVPELEKKINDIIRSAVSKEEYQSKAGNQKTEDAKAEWVIKNDSGGSRTTNRPQIAVEAKVFTAKVTHAEVAGQLKAAGVAVELNSMGMFSSAALTDAQSSAIEKWMASLAGTSGLVCPKVRVYDSEKTQMALTDTHTFTTGYEGDTPKVDEFTTGVKFEFTPQLRKEENIILLQLAFDKTMILNIMKQTTDSGRETEMPGIGTQSVHTTIAIPQGKTMLVPVAGTGGMAGMASPAPKSEQIFLLIKTELEKQP